MPSGKVKWFNERKGFGFITQEDGSERFVHYSDFDGFCFRVLAEGDEVEFEVVKSDRGPKAVHVTKKG
ncbi:MAG: cold shock domain-containing protein [Candidatus Stahlbacteria bacterium]|nr:cold shock domain-containing protein [Candidatus Stahlbacteria bacterium]